MIKNKKYLFIILALFTLLIVLKHFTPQPVNWEPSFNGYRKIPYGCSVLKELLDSVYPGTKQVINDKSFFESLDTAITGQNLIVLNTEFNPDKTDLGRLITFVSHGNCAFISALSFSENFTDTLHVETETGVFDTTLLKNKSEHLKLQMESETSLDFAFHRKMPDHYISAFDSLNSVILGTDNQGRPNYMVTSVGKGRIYLHCQPLAFTNYHLLYGNYRYAYTALTIIPASLIIWDQYYKPDKAIDNSPVRYILSNAALRSAYYVIVFSLLIYIILGWRRKQRIIPVIQPVQNTSLDFIRTIAKLYYKTFNHADIAKKKLIYTGEYIKTRYGLKLPFGSQDELESAANKTGVDAELLHILSVRYKNLDQIWDFDSQDLLKLHQNIEKFYKNCK